MHLSLGQKIWRKGRIIILIFLTLSAGFYLWDLINDRSNKIVVLKNTKAYEDWKLHDHQEPVGVVTPEDKIKVLRIRYGQDFMAIQIGRDDGSSPWIFYQKGEVEFVPR
jgi:hypothetical protein